MKPNLGTILGVITLVGAIGGAAMSIERSRIKMETLEKENATLLVKTSTLENQVEELGWWSTAVRQELKDMKSRR